MARQRTEQQMARDRRDAKTMADASWALRRLTDRKYYNGAGATLYSVCELLDRASLSVSEVDLGVRGCLLKVAQGIQRDLRIDAGENPSNGLV